MKRIFSILSTALVCLSLGGVVRPASAKDAEPKEKLDTVTVYFCGTGITKDWWDKAKAHNWNNTSGFWVPELVSTLFHEQKAAKGSGHYKTIIDGIGTGVNLALFDLLAQGFASSPANPRGWTKCLGEGTAFLNKSLSETKNDVILNVVGHSRGGVLSIWLAHEAAKNPRVKAINVIAFDPVPGDANGPSPAVYKLDKKVKHYVGIYAEDERTMLFEPVIPMAATTETKMWVLSVPGTHETFVGNTQVDGHSGDYHALDVLQITESWSDAMKPVGTLTKLIAVKLLGSAAWGGVEFSWDGKGEKIEDLDKEMRSAAAKKLYSYQRTISFIPFVLPFTSLQVFNKGAILKLSGPQIAGQHLQDMQRAIFTIKNGKWDLVGLQDTIPVQNGKKIAEKLKEFGG